MEYFSQVIFESYRDFINREVGIFFSNAKKDMLKLKVVKMMTPLGITSYDEYLKLISTSGGKQFLTEFINEIAINKTDFFRENNHFEFLRGNAKFILENNKTIEKNREIRVWSSACSTGEEPYTLGFILKEYYDTLGLKTRILATDIDTKALNLAINGIYPQTITSNVGKYWLSKYCNKFNGNYQIKKEIRDMITFRLFNLMNNFPFEKKFDIIFCRNVMIYFEPSVQQKIIDKFYDALEIGGLLFIGHSETLNNKNHKFRYLRPTIYQK
ncbi:protein-glutamate O-methyltransferase CheR [Clostridium sp.]|uniref:CheR family methyltransferase n=1 Tax=Clostridium sp. TaxID=1506 RepID=UPI0026364FBB|nr:protein-glutamate O-methyltransferase CheR [Clostridium sp.]